MRTTYFGLALVAIVSALVEHHIFAADPPELSAPSQLDSDPKAEFHCEGRLADYVSAITDNWLLRAPDDNPGMLGMFADRDHQPYRDLLPWSGEFAGKYLSAGTEVLRLTGDPRLRAYLQNFVDHLIALQDGDGYLGAFPKNSHLTGKAPNCALGGATWDGWNHYHIMLGLLLWNGATGDAKALTCAERIGDLLCDRFLGGGRHILDMGSPDQNQSVMHSLCLLYEKTGEQRYLDLAEQIVKEFEAPGAGDYVRTALAGKPFYATPKPRWESLHAIMGLAELYRITANEDDCKAFEQIWWSIDQYDRHNNGGFSSGEQAVGDPYDPRAIETCCSIAWIAMSREMLRLTANPIVADELELSTLNQVFGLQSRTGKWCTYNTPMDGVRKPSSIDVAFQKRVGTEQLSCCSVNAARGFGMVADWAVLQDRHGGIVLNWYGSSHFVTHAGDTQVTLRQVTDYPRSGDIILRVEPEKPVRFNLMLRLPQWSAVNSLTVNGEAVAGIKPGTYQSIDRIWKAGDELHLQLDMSLHYWPGEKRCAGKASIYRGPILLACEDFDFNKLGPGKVQIDARALTPRLCESRANGPMVEVELPAGGNVLKLLDYATAGENGKAYRTWLPIEHAAPAEFTPDKTFRTTRAAQ